MCYFNIKCLSYFVKQPLAVKYVICIVSSKDKKES